MVDELEPEEVAQRVRAAPERVVLLDVREPYERELAAIEPSLHIPMNEVAGRIEELPKDKELVVYCHGGARSMMVASFLEHRGFAPVANLAGGIDAWSRKVDPNVPRYG
jgi:rhodanese-related sulfurtransferase